MPGLIAGELALSLGAGFLIAVAVTWPLVTDLSGRIAHDLGDPLLQAWQVAWDGHALLHQPLHFFDANIFWPLRHSLAVSDSLAGYAPFGLLGHGVGAAVARYNLLYLFAYALAFAGAYLLAREIGLPRLAAAVAGLAFAYTPFRLGQDAHLHVVSSGGIPLSLFLLIRGYRRSRPWTAFAGWCVAAWQVTLGFTLGLPLAYLLALALVVFAVLWWRRGRPALPRALVVASIAGGVLLAVTTALMARPYLEVAHDHPEARHSLAEVRAFSPPVAGLVIAPAEDPVWGRVGTGLRRRTFGGGTEQTIFPGVAILALAAFGLYAAPWPRRVKAWLLVAIATITLLALGTTPFGGRLSYRLLYDFAPGWQGIRTPGRLMTFASLPLALLAGAGAAALLARRVQGLALVALAAVLIVAEGSGWSASRAGAHPVIGPPHPTVPQPPAIEAGAPEPRLELPVTPAAEYRYVLWSTAGFPRIANGVGSFDPRSFLALVRSAHGFPDARSAALLRREGFRSVVVHPATGAVVYRLR